MKIDNWIIENYKLLFITGDLCYNICNYLKKSINYPMSFFCRPYSKKITKIIKQGLNYHYTFFALALIILAQFILVSIIYFHRQESDIVLKQIQNQVSQISAEQNLLNQKLNTLQSNLNLVQTQIFRMNQAEE